MKVENYIGWSRGWRFRLTVLLLSLGFAQVNVLSQPAASASSTASLRGTAKVNGTLVVEGVMVVLKPAPAAARGGGGSARANGNPIPARVTNNGEYRIDDLSAGSYDLVATGKPIIDKKLRVNIKPGNSNVVDVTLERVQKRTRMRGKIMNSGGTALPRTTVAIYSAELPPSICEECVIAQVVSNEDGEIDYPDLASEQAYSLAIRIQILADDGNYAELITADAITIGAAAEALVELRIGGALQPSFTATLLPSDHPAPGALKSMEAVANNPGGTVTIPKDQKSKIAGVIIRRDSDTFTMRDRNGRDTVVRLENRTSVKVKDGSLRSGENYGQTQLLRGLALEVEGRGNESGELVARKVRFKESDLRVARSIDTTVGPLEDRATISEKRISEVEENAQRLSGQLDELNAVAHVAKGGANAALATADAAVAGINATNERISALDDYDPQAVMAVTFRTGSATLTQDSKAMLDELAAKAVSAKGYVFEVSGFADSTGSVARNRTLSQRRADAVIRYLFENHSIPLRRIITPYGYGEANPIADNMSRTGRAANRRVEIKLLVNRGLNQANPVNPQ